MVMFHINSDTPEGKELRKKYSVKGLPTSIVLTGDGAEVDRILGYDDRASYLKTLLGYLYGVDTLDDLLGRSKDDAGRELRVQIAEKYLGRGNPSDALTWLAKAREAVEKKPGEAQLAAAEKPATPPDVMQRLALLEGEAWLETDTPKGEAALKKIILDAPPKDPAGEEAFSEISRYYKKNKKDQELLSLFSAMMPSRGEDPNFLNDFAWTFAEKGMELDKALEAAKKAVVLSKDDPGILDTLAEVYFRKGDKKSAVETIDRALKQKPDDDYFKKQREKFQGDVPKGAKG